MDVIANLTMSGKVLLKMLILVESLNSNVEKNRIFTDECSLFKL